MRKCTLSDFLVCVLFLGLVTGCSGRRAGSETERADEPENKDQKIENLVSALSRAQSRIEELDAKVMSLTDKLESTRVTVDNISGNRPVKTETLGSARTAEDHAADQNAEPTPKALSGSEAKALLQMDSAINEFNKAIKLFKSGKYADSELAFNHFTETYPEHILAGSAQFYSGESYFNMKEYKLALNEYGKVVSSFSSSPRVASALVRMSHCYEATGATSEATRTMALAKDLFIGNPTLDWTSPTGTTNQKSELNTGPIEPAEKEKHEE